MHCELLEMRMKVSLAAIGASINLIRCLSHNVGQSVGTVVGLCVCVPRYVAPLVASILPK